MKAKFAYSLPADPRFPPLAVAEIDLDRITANYRAVEQAVGGAQMLPVLKANAYGHGLVPVARHLETLEPAGLAVAFVEEGALIRQAGVRCPILVMGGIDVDQIPYYIAYDLTITASSTHKLRQIDRAAARLRRTARVHLKIDTGLGRIGMRPDTAPAMFEAALAAKRVEVEAVYSHFATADSPDPGQTRRQLGNFLRAVSFYAERGLPAPKLHIANSGAILQHPDSYLDMVRPGILLYGVYPAGPGEVPRTVEVSPALTWKTRVVYFKVQPAGSPVSYGAAWAPDRDTRVITVPVGYGHGYFRRLSGRSHVIVGGRRRPVVGKVCMDQMMVDIGPDGEAYNGDEVVLLGSQGEAEITASELAEWAGTIPYEVFTAINNRVERRYTRGGQGVSSAQMQWYEGRGANNPAAPPPFSGI